MTNSVTVISFYKFVDLQALDNLRDDLHAFCVAQHIKGTILLASEGINATVAGTEVAIDALQQYLSTMTEFSDMMFKVSQATFVPFARMVVKIKPEIVKFNQPTAIPSEQVGTYVAPKDWNDLITSPDVLVIDTRNRYEVEIGTFEGAENTNTETFSELPDYLDAHVDPKQHKKVAMFCTGGIRCEKSTSYLLNRGFEEVYHLEGGILNYLAQVPVRESKWRGECFIFDDRVSLDHDLQKGSYTVCADCDQIISADGQIIERLKSHQLRCEYCNARYCNL